MQAEPISRGVGGGFWDCSCFCSPGIVVFHERFARDMMEIHDLFEGSCTRGSREYIYIYMYVCIIVI